MRGSRWLVLALMLNGCGIYEAHEAKKNNAAVLADFKTQVLRCQTDPTQTTHVARATCINMAEAYDFERLTPPLVSIAVQQNALRLRLAEQQDAGQITNGQAAEQMAAQLAQIQADEQAAAYQQQQLQAARPSLMSCISASMASLGAPATQGGLAMGAEAIRRAGC